MAFAKKTDESAEGKNAKSSTEEWAVPARVPTDVFYTRTQDHLKAGNLTAAQKSMATATYRDPNHEKDSAGLSAQLQTMTEKLASFDAKVTKEPDNIYSYVARALAKLLLTPPQDPTSDCQEVLMRDLSQPLAYLFKAIWQLYKNDHKAAKDTCDNAYAELDEDLPTGDLNAFKIIIIKAELKKLSELIDKRSLKPILAQKILAVASIIELDVTYLLEHLNFNSSPADAKRATSGGQKPKELRA